MSNERPHGAIIVIRRGALVLVTAAGELPRAPRAAGESVEAGVRRALRAMGLAAEARFAGLRWDGWQLWTADTDGAVVADHEWVTDPPDDADGLGPYELKPLVPEQLSGVRHTFATTTVRRRQTVLVVSFAGGYGIGSRGNGDAVAMAAAVRMGRELARPLGVVLDLTGLDYEWGDLMTRPLEAAVVDGVLPAVVVSDRCRTAIGTLLRGELGGDWVDLATSTVDEGVAAVAGRLNRQDVAHRLGATREAPTFDRETVEALVGNDLDPATGHDRAASLRTAVWQAREHQHTPGGADELFVERAMLLADLAATAADPALFPNRVLNAFLMRYEVAGLRSIAEPLGAACPNWRYRFLHDLPTPLLDAFVAALDGGPVREALVDARDHRHRLIARL